MAFSSCSKFIFCLSSDDKKTLKAFRTLLQLDGIETFNSDDFRRYGLDRFIGNKVYGIGGLFAKLKHEGLIYEVGTVRSTIATNHGRVIRLYRWAPTPTEEST